MSHDTPISAPRLPTPPGACDTHLHIYEPGFEMRASSSHPSQPATLAHYRELQKRLGLTRAVIVQPSAYGADWTQDEALRRRILVDNAAALYRF